MKLKFAHLADPHIGSWRDRELRRIALDAFLSACDMCVEEGADFVVISGDLFDTSMPSIENLVGVVAKLRELNEKGISIYAIPGSHDFSPTMKTMLHVLEKAGLLTLVSKGREVNGKLKLDFTVDPKTGAKLTGIIGKRGALEKEIYENLDRKAIEKEEGLKVFVFHTALSELKPLDLEKMESLPTSLLPKGFDYYAGGHVHRRLEKRIPGRGLVCYPGALFATDFEELEREEKGGFYLVSAAGGEVKAEYREVKTRDLVKVKIGAEGKAAVEVEQELREAFEALDCRGRIVLIRLEGTLESGKPSDIDLGSMREALLEKGAVVVKTNTNKLGSKEFGEIRVRAGTREEIERELIEEHLGQVVVKGWSKKKEKEVILALMKTLSAEKDEGESVADYDSRVAKAGLECLEVER